MTERSDGTEQEHRRSGEPWSVARQGAERSPLRIVIHGARGRMGARLCALVGESRAFVLAAALDQVGSESGSGGGSGAEAGGEPAPMGTFDAIIDFSSPQGALAALEHALSAGAALVVGTTGLSQEIQGSLRAASSRIPVLLAPNTSLGVVVMRHLVREAARLLKGFDVDIIESHHNRKKDAPSGTALALAAAAVEGGAAVPAERIHALRGGDIVGEHAVHFAGPGETIRLEHSAVSRDLFALGALRAAAWLVGRPPGWYAMEDVVGLSARR